MRDSVSYIAKRQRALSFRALLIATQAPSEASADDLWHISCLNHSFAEARSRSDAACSQRPAQQSDPGEPHRQVRRPTMLNRCARGGAPPDFQLALLGLALVGPAHYLLPRSRIPLMTPRTSPNPCAPSDDSPGLLGSCSDGTGQRLARANPLQIWKQLLRSAALPASRLQHRLTASAVHCRK
jgi:hypothetical protein